MAKSMTLFDGGMPAHLQGGELSDTAKALAGGGAGGGKWISIKGATFRMMEGSQEIATNEERGMNMIVVASAPGYARTYYAGAYKEGVKSQPACWSDDNQTPSENATDPQSRMCANCPQNAKGSDSTTGGRACRYSARLAVMLEGDEDYAVYGLNVPATSIFGSVDNEKYESLQDYVKKLASHQYDVVKVVTEFRFDTKSPVPKLMFRAVRPLTKDEWEASQDAAGSEEVKAVVGPRIFSDPAPEAAPAAPKEPLFADDEEEEEKPKRRTSRASKAKQGVEEKDEDLAAILDEWDD